MTMTSRCLTHFSKISRSGNNNINIKRSITTHAPLLNSVENGNTAYGFLRNNGTNCNNYHKQVHYYSSTTCRKFSSQEEEPSMLDRMRSKLSLSSSKKESNEAMQFERLANMETFTVADFQGELERSRTWKEKMFGFMDKENKERVDKILKLVKIIRTQVKDGSRVLDLGRKDKIVICMKADDDEISLEDVNEVLALFTNMDFMHRLLRYRKENGKSLPTDEDGMRIAAEEDQAKVITKREKKAMQQKMMRGAKRQ